MNELEQPDIHRLITEQMADAVVHVDATGVIRGWNSAAETLFGYGKDEAIGQSVDLIVPERLRAAHWAGFERAMARGATQHGGRATITRALRRSGEPLYVEMSFAVVRDGQGKSLGAVAVARDATQRHAAEKQARAQPAESPADSSSPLGLATRAIHGSSASDSHGSPHLPIYNTTTFTFPSTAALLDVVEGRKPGGLYTRYGLNPSIFALEETLAGL